MPDAVPAARDATRLKTQLVGKKRDRDRDESEAIANRTGDEDEEESRAGAIKKKVKLDPFDKPKRKKKSESSIPSPSVQAAPPTSREAEIGCELGADMVAPNSASVPQSSNRRKKNKSLDPPAPAISVASGSGYEDAVETVTDSISSTLTSVSKEKPGSFPLEPSSMLKSNTPGQDVADKLDVLSTSSGSQRGMFKHLLRPAGSAQGSNRTIATFRYWHQVCSSLFNTDQGTSFAIETLSRLTEKALAQPSGNL